MQTISTITNNTGKKNIKLGLLLFLIAAMTTFSNNVIAQDKNRMVRIAKLQIDSMQLENYKAMLKEEIETSLRVEPGVLMLNAVQEKNNPTRITIMEVYADEAAYRSHIETPHFKKYKEGTKSMVKSLELIEAVPIVLDTKSRHK